ncbi:MAG: DUF1499 domain-containing protein [Proteobacteria bacterium]|nr:DUF1499 domain-containing protein [Pseudomonadota bacterium]
MLKRLLLGLGLLLAGAAAGVALHTAFTQGDTVFAGKRPSNLGVADGRLAPPKRTPNCVASQADPADAEHYIAPIAYSGSPGEAIAILRRIVDGSERTLVLKQDGNYLYAEYKSKLMGFVDDVEFYASPKEGVIHVRSASRLGRRDFGVNRARIESIRARFGAATRGTAAA